ncbi:MAG: hypothetical protein AAGN66_09565 [Acidobacteriota bacterium]
MSSTFRVILDKPGIPDGAVSVEDASTLLDGFGDAIARTVQYHLGLPVRGRLRKEAKPLARVALVGVKEGSGVLELQPLPTGHDRFRNPAVVASIDLVSAISEFGESRTWPKYFQPIVRNRLGKTFADVMSDSAVLSLEVEDGNSSYQCLINKEVKEALLEPETFSSEEILSIVGEIYDINVEGSYFKVKAGPRKITVEVDPKQLLMEVDSLRWERVSFAAVALDSKGRRVGKISDLRLAEESEHDGVEKPEERERGKAITLFVALAERAEELKKLDKKWDSYRASKPRAATFDFAVEFADRIGGLLADHGVYLPEPFLVPTFEGGAQLEWNYRDRELEIEIPEMDQFRYLRVAEDIEEEGALSRWEAARMIRWLATGEEV